MNDNSNDWLVGEKKDFRIDILCLNRIEFVELEIPGRNFSSGLLVNRGLEMY